VWPEKNADRYVKMRIPESFKPGKVDIFGFSHQIFHVLVVLAIIVHLIGIVFALDYNYRHKTCVLA
jgi:adiponectin receptor